VIYDRPSGGVTVRCLAHCEQSAVIQALKARKLWPQSGARKSPGQIAERDARRAGDAIKEIVSPIPPELLPSLPPLPVLNRRPPTAAYAYRSTAGELLGYVARWESLVGPKEIRPVSLVRRVNGELGWSFKAPARYTLYGLEYLPLRPDADVVIVEGEKAADAARRLLPECVVLSWRGGAAAVEKNDFGPLRGRNVTIVPDADDPGRSAAAAVAAKCAAEDAAIVRVVSVPAEFDSGWDMADPFPPGWNVQKLLELAVKAPSENTPNDRPAEPRSLLEFVLTAPELASLEIPPREYIIEPFLATQSTNMLYAKRGLGKTWTAMTLALNVAQGEDFFGYSVSSERKVLYIDGEMPTADLQRRLLALAPAPPENLMIVPSEALFREDRPLNVQDETDRARVIQLLADLEADNRRPELIILDNLSSLSGGVDENDNSALDDFLQWLIALRHMGYAIMIIHHAGKSGSQRGASRREDLLDTSIELKEPPKKDEEGEDLPIHPGAHFVLWFPKTRDRRPEPDELELKLMEEGAQLVWAMGEVRVIDRSIKLLKAIWLTKPSTQKELAMSEHISDGRVSQLCTKLRKKGYLHPDQPPRLTPEGKEAVLKVFPELEAQMLQQGELGFRDVI
jgi:hypothetical protein